MPETIAPPQRVDLTTARFRLAGLRPEMITETQCDWLRNPAVATPLNIAVGAVSLAALRRQMSAGNGVTAFHIGISDRDGNPIGYYMIGRDPGHRTATFNVLIGDTAWWGKGVVIETRAALLDHFFAERGIDKAIGMPLARNFPAVFNYKRQGWRLEGTMRQHVLAHDKSGRLDQLQFGMLADDWRVLREASR